MKTKGANIILLNNSGAALLYLRDNKPEIPYPNMWCLPGGLLEEGEAPTECILREIKEEMGLELEEISLFSSADLSYGTEYTFWAKVDFATEDITLTEGQDIKWFTEEEIRNTKLGYEDNSILASFAAGHSHLV